MISEILVGGVIYAQRDPGALANVWRQENQSIEINIKNALSFVQCRYPYSKIYARINMPYQCIFPHFITLHPTFFESQMLEPKSQGQPPSPPRPPQKDLSEN